MLISALLHSSVDAPFRGIGENTPHSTDGDIKLRQHHAHRTPESCDMLLYLAGVNEHAGLRIAGSKKQAMESITLADGKSVLFDHGVHFLAT
jgi:hypothetical protein